MSSPPVPPRLPDAASAWRWHGAPPRGAGTPDAGADAVCEPVRLLAPSAASPFAPGREIRLARVQGSLLERLGVRDGDHVAVWRSDAAEHGDLAAVADPSGRAALWRVYPENDRLRLSTGDPAQSRCARAGARVRGVVVGVLRRFPA